MRLPLLTRLPEDAHHVTPSIAAVLGRDRDWRVYSRHDGGWMFIDVQRTLADVVEKHGSEDHIETNPPEVYRAFTVDRSGHRHPLGAGPLGPMRETAMATWLGDPEVRSAYVLDRVGHSHLTLEPRDRGRLQANARLSAAQRSRLPAHVFVFPRRRAWPIENARAARAAIQHLQMGHVASASDYLAIMSFVRKHFPGVWRQYGGKLAWSKSKAAKTKARTSRRKAAHRRTSRRVA